MITNVWLKSQPNKKISYPDCYPTFNMFLKNEHIFIISPNSGTIHQATYQLKVISRIEFRP